MSLLGWCPIATKNALTAISFFSPVCTFFILTPSTFFSPSISSVSLCQFTVILLVLITLSCITLLALISPLRTIMCTWLQILDRYKASSAAVSPAPTIATSFSLKKKPSQTAQALTPYPFNLCSLSIPSHLADAPVEMITASASIHFSSSICTKRGCTEKSTFVARPYLISVPIRLA